MPDWKKLRASMVVLQLARRGIRDSRILEAMGTVPRELFLGAGQREFAYDDTALPIEHGQTISQPWIVAMTLQAAAVRGDDRVLEIGTGSGYAAAVLGELAQRVISIERHPALANSARRRLRKLGYTHVEIYAADGTLGWPAAAPFDVIVAAAGGPRVPEAWRDQLAIGGRLVMPVGEQRNRQRLLKLTRRSTTEFIEEDLGAVMFVPLIGAQAWSARDEDAVSAVEAEEAEEADDGAPVSPSAAPAQEGSLAAVIRAAAEPLPDPASTGFAQAFDRFADRRIVLLGEASHGTAEFYQARAAITQRLVEAHGFTIVAVEADWPDAASIDRYVRDRPAPPQSEPAFRRFPTWMWRNTDVQAFVDWLRGYNVRRAADHQAGFYGLDLYSLSGSIAAVLDYLDQVDPDAAHVARERYACLTPWQKDPAVYGRAVLSQRYEQCTDEVVAQLRDLLAKRLEYAQHDGVRFLDAAQNARLIAAAERYYRVMYHGSAQSWNLRDTHMFETLNHILDDHGTNARAVVWAHNSHIGNAAATDMGQVRDEINIGQLCRERYGDDIALIGFGMHHGTVAAASDWDGPMEVKRVRAARKDSYEHHVHLADLPRGLLDLRPGKHETLRARLLPPLLERFIGVIYRPETELQSHYASASLPDQFDAYVWFDETRAVTPLPTQNREGVPETWPFGV